jgi:23S rRNA G2445 N2-methylase RlmL
VIKGKSVDNSNRESVSAIAGDRREVLADGVELYLGDMTEIMPSIGLVDHVVCDPPYEDELHEAIGRIRRNDGQEMIQDLGFDGINATRADVAAKLVHASQGWAIIFTLAEGVRAWRDALQAAQAKWAGCGPYLGSLGGGKQPDMFIEKPKPATQVSFAELWKAPYWNEEGTAPA